MLSGCSGTGVAVGVRVAVGLGLAVKVGVAVTRAICGSGRPAVLVGKLHAASSPQSRAAGSMVVRVRERLTGDSVPSRAGRVD